MELEVDSKIPFLDALVHQQSDGALRTAVYKKPTYTGQYLHFDSNHSHNVEMGVAECPCITGYEICVCSDDRDREEEFRCITNTLKLNGYTDGTLSKAKAIRTTQNERIERQ
ncbi:hypothetical protein Trydic_g20752 [Trypoxylus dichotomus]